MTPQDTFRERQLEGVEGHRHQNIRIQKVRRETKSRPSLCRQTLTLQTLTLLLHKPNISHPPKPNQPNHNFSYLETSITRDSASDMLTEMSIDDAFLLIKYLNTSTPSLTYLHLLRSQNRRHTNTGNPKYKIGDIVRNKENNGRAVIAWWEQDEKEGEVEYIVIPCQNDRTSFPLVGNLGGGLKGLLERVGLNEFLDTDVDYEETIEGGIWTLREPLSVLASHGVVCKEEELGDLEVKFKRIVLPNGGEEDGLVIGDVESDFRKRGLFEGGFDMEMGRFEVADEIKYCFPDDQVGKGGTGIGSRKSDWR